MSMQGAQIDFQGGTVIFKQGDPGGDLYFIKEGDVEVFREENGQEVSLAVLTAGEILGIMTCLTREPRLASARAKGAVRAVVVKQAGIKTLISSTPPWVNTVIKDFTLRVKQMNDLYARSMTKQREGSLLGVSGFFANGLRELGAMLTPGDAPDRVIDLDVITKRLAKVLGVVESDLDRIFRVFVEVGLVKMELGAQVRRAELTVLDRLQGFAVFARDFQASESVRKSFETLVPGECALLLAACDKGASVDLADPAMKGAVEKAVSLGLAKIEGAKATLVHVKLGHALRCLAAVRKLRELTPAPRDEAAAIQILSENF